MSKELSDLSLERKECPKCGAVWLNGQHIWTGTGKRGNELDLLDWFVTSLVMRHASTPRKERLVVILGRSG